jgi:hypothetical protein
MFERLLGGAAALALVAMSSAAFAQGMDAFSVPSAPPSGAASTTPSRDAESFEPFGVRVGSFKLFPVAELWEIYNTNVFAAQNNQSDDWITVIKPSLSLQSDWNLHALVFDAFTGVGRYADNTAENFIDYGARAQGKLDLPAWGRDTALFGGLAYSKLHEDRGSPDAVNGRDPTEYSKTTGGAGFQYKPGRLGFLLNAFADSYNFDDVATSANTIINNDDRDRIEYRESLRVGYEIQPGYEAFVRGTLRQVRYDTTPDDSGFRRNSNGYDAVGGVKIDLGRITNVELYGGYLSNDYSDARLSTVSGVSFGGAVNWEPLRNLKVRGSADRSVQETTDANFAGYLATTFRIGADYDFRPNISFNTSVSYTMNEYQRNTTFRGNEREDDIINAEVGMKYMFSRNYYVNPSYRYTTRDSNVTGSDYDRSLVFVKLGAQY